MASRPSTASRRYAEALFDLAQRDDGLDAYADGMEVAVGALGQEQVLDVLRNPALPMRQRSALVDELVAKRVPAPIRKLIALLVERGRIDILPGVGTEFRRLINEQRGIVEALATVAAPLTSDETQELQRKLAEMTGRSVDLRVRVDDALIGGITVRVGDTLYDASVRGRLERLRERLLSTSR